MEYPTYGTPLTSIYQGSVLCLICGHCISVKMASPPSPNSGQNEISNMIRQCVREEIDFQRSGRRGTSSVLNRTRELIASASRSACQEFENNRVPLNPPTTPSSIPMGSGLPKRPVEATPSHPWRFKRNKKGTAKPKAVVNVTKQIYLLDEPPQSEVTQGHVADYTIVDEMILLKGYCDFATTFTEAEIRKEISETIKQRFPLMSPEFFDFVKRERNSVITPVVKPSHKWDFKQVKELCSQGKLYVRLNISTESFLAEPTEEAEEGHGMFTHGDEQTCSTSEICSQCG